MCCDAQLLAPKKARSWRQKRTFIYYLDSSIYSLLGISTPTHTHTCTHSLRHARTHARSAVTLLTAALPVGLKQSGHRIAFPPLPPSLAPALSFTHANTLVRAHARAHASSNTHRHILTRWLFIKLHCQICQALNFGDMQVVLVERKRAGGEERMRGEEPR